MTGVPAFIGYADPDPRVLDPGRLPAAVLDHWNAVEFNALIKPQAGSWLAMAVRGFFANGGKRCVLVPVGSDGLSAVLEPGGALEERTDIDLVCVPDAAVHAPGDGAPVATDDPYEIQAAALDHCAAMGDRFAILDAPDPGPPVDAGQDPVDAVLRRASSLRSAFGALYFPWIACDRTRDALALRAPPAGNQEWRCLARPQAGDARRPLEYGPPCGHVAGLIARIDALVGPQRSPANASLEDVVDVSVHLSAPQHALLNRGGVNCLRRLPGRGIDVGGARTLSGHSALAFVSAARVVSGFRRWLELGLRDLVFEPNSTMLWDRIRLRLVSRCFELLRSGALAGSDPARAFFVKCDSETNPPDDTDLGRVVAHVGLAPSVPAEFIVVRVEHDPSGVTVSSLS
jgi:phage tail sheath protein FI